MILLQILSIICVVAFLGYFSLVIVVNIRHGGWSSLMYWVEEKGLRLTGIIIVLTLIFLTVGIVIN